jgi:hypothetical protein
MTRVLIAISTRSEQARYTDFFRSLHQLDLSGLDCRIELFPGWFSYENKNNAIKLARQGSYEYIFFVDDDQIFVPQTLKMLLAHNVDIVSVNLINKTPPFHPYLFSDWKEDGAEPMELEGSGLIKVAACGLGGVLVRTAVFGNVGNFFINDVLKTEDLTFCMTAVHQGYNVHVDLDCPSGHITTCVVWPQKTETDWQTVIVMNNILRIPVPKAKRVDDRHMGIPGAKCI